MFLGRYSSAVTPFLAWDALAWFLGLLPLNAVEAVPAGNHRLADQRAWCEANRAPRVQEGLEGQHMGSPMRAVFELKESWPGG